jgi:hypothetical protein
MLASMFLILVVALTWAHTFRPGLNTVKGSTLLVARVPLLARIRMHAPGALFSVALAVVFALVGMVSWWLVAVAIGSALLLAAIPVSYTITDQGIRLGLASFRRWTEFAAVRRAPGGARLIGVPKARGMHIWLSGSRGDDEFLLFLRQTLKGAYKGTSGAGRTRPTLEVEADGGSELYSVATVNQ